MTRICSLLCLVSVVVACAGCGDDRRLADTSVPDADVGVSDSAVSDSRAPDGAVDSGRAVQCGGNECSIVTGDGCPIAQGCYFLSRGPNTEPMAICQPTGFGTDGTPCMAQQDCQSGWDCVPGLRVCRKLCCFGDDSACPSGQRCATRYVWMDAAGTTLQTDGAYCSGSTTCDPLAQTGCGTEACYTDTPGDGSVICAMAGPGTEGEACVALNDCAAGLYCVGSGAGTQCHRYCAVSTGMPCGAGQTCTPLGFPAPLEDLGMCTPPT